MEHLISELLDLMEDRYRHEVSQNLAYQEYQRVHHELCDALHKSMGLEFCDKLCSTTARLTEIEQEAAFTWGLRLGLDLHAL